MKIFRTEQENVVGGRIANIFTESSDSVEVKLENFPKYVRRQPLKRFLALYEIFKRVLPVKGSVIECGVYKGFGLMSWAKLSAMLEPENLTRRIYGFDTFTGFPPPSDKDNSLRGDLSAGDFNSDSHDELTELIVEYDKDRFLGHIDKVHLVKGDVNETIPKFVLENPHLIVSLLFLDFDLYDPTKMALDNFLPRMPKGSIVAFDELDNPLWPGESLALLESIGISSLKLERFEWDPYISFAVVE